VFEDRAPCAVCGSAVELVSRDEAPVPEADGPIGPSGGVVGAGDEPVDARVCTNPDCPTHADGGPSA
jgi:hypothetical protein